MSKPAIRVENLSKAYRIGVREETPDTLMEAMKGIIAAPVRNLRELMRLDTSLTESGPDGAEQGEESGVLWALRDVSFEIPEGEVVGVIGRNGAGKSTLLKVLSRITEPTAGRVTIRGRISSLLEVGTGFHPELTGRENIYMNGTILGMTKKEIDRKFDEIVDFSGVEGFLDTPTKRYSSGMQVRLAFAVAANLEPEILIVDEVLAVGDTEFQKKCLGKMQDVASSGRTVAFVSHDLTAVESLCSIGMIMERGCNSQLMSSSEAVATYVRRGNETGTAVVPLDDKVQRRGGSEPIMQSAWITSESDTPVSSVKLGEACRVHVKFDSPAKAISPVIGVVIKTQRNHCVFTVNNRFGTTAHDLPRVHSGEIVCDLGEINLVPGSYAVDLYFGSQQIDLDVVFDTLHFDIVETDYFGTGKLPSARFGHLCWRADWTLDSEGSLSKATASSD